MEEDEVKRLNEDLFFILTDKTEGESLVRVMGVPSGEGFLAYQKVLGGTSDRDVAREAVRKRRSWLYNRAWDMMEAWRNGDLNDAHIVVYIADGQEASPEEVRGLAMLGASPMTWGRDADLSTRRDLEVLSLLASEDEICSPKKGAVLRYGGGLVEEQFKKLPKSTRRVVIKGGNHAGFGDYGIQAYDGERTISLEDHQDQTARHLVSFLKRVRKRG